MTSDLQGMVAEDLGAELREINKLVVETLTGLLGRLTTLEAGVAALHAEVVAGHNLQKNLHLIQRRDLRHGLDVEALASSARFIQEHLPTAPRFRDPHATLRHGASLVTIPGMVTEFGVASGTTLEILVAELPSREVYGFDVFTGLPEDWRTGYPAGSFARRPPDVPGAQLVVGLFEETLPTFVAEHQGPIALMHLDADLYSSTATVLDHLGDRLVPGSVVVFDEYFNYPGWQQHEHRAWQEFVARTGIEYTYEGYTANHEQVVVRIMATRARG